MAKVITVTQVGINNSAYGPVSKQIPVSTIIEITEPTGSVGNATIVVAEGENMPTVYINVSESTATVAALMNSETQSGNLEIGGDLEVEGNATVGGTLGVTGTTTLTALSVTGNASMTGLTTLSGVVNRAKTATAVNATATTTAAVIRGGLITSTSAAATNITLPTATQLATELGAQKGDSFEFVVDNTAGANTVTITPGAGTTATAVITGGNTMTVGASATTGIGTFRLTFISTTAAVISRIL